MSTAVSPLYEENKVKRQLLVLLTVMTISLAAQADQLTLQNGDHISGTITKYDGKTVIIKTDYAGDVTIQFSAVKEIHSDQPLHVEFTGGSTALGPVSAADNEVTVATSGNIPVSRPLNTVVTMRDADEQTAYEKSLHPPLTRGWVGGANFGFGLTGGNSETESFNLAMNADRKTTHDDITLYATSVYATNNEPGAAPSTTANTVQGGIRYSRNFSPRVFGFVNSDFQTDALQDLNLRSVFGGGIGYRLINTDRTTLDLLGGINYTNEEYSLITNRFAALTLGEELSHKFGASTIISEKAYIFPDLQDTSQYRATFNFGTVTKINKWFGWQNAFGDVYVTNPPAGKKTNDVIFTTGLNFSFTH
jgi:putative salt-induced outer membrane protein YdiY